MKWSTILLICLLAISLVTVGCSAQEKTSTRIVQEVNENAASNQNVDDVEVVSQGEFIEEDNSVEIGELI